MKKKADNTRYFAWIKRDYEFNDIPRFVKLAIINENPRAGSGFSGITYSGERVDADFYDYDWLRYENFNDSERWCEVEESEAALLL